MSKIGLSDGYIALTFSFLLFLNPSGLNASRVNVPISQ